MGQCWYSPVQALHTRFGYEVVLQVIMLNADGQVRLDDDEGLEPG